MPRQRAHSHLSIIINDHRMVSLADEDQPYEFEWPDMQDIQTGADGGKYGRAIPDFGCGLTIRVSDVSPSLQHFIRERTAFYNALRNGSAIPTFRGTITDLAFNVSGTMEGGWLAMLPGFIPAAGQTAELMFGFELWTPNVEGGAFERPLVATA